MKVKSITSAVLLGLASAAQCAQTEAPLSGDSHPKSKVQITHGEFKTALFKAGLISADPTREEMAAVLQS